MLKPMRGYTSWAKLPDGDDQIVANIGQKRYDGNGDLEYKVITQHNQILWLHIDHLYDKDTMNTPHLGKIESHGTDDQPLYTTPERWDCECASIGNNYIHSKDHTFCLRCFADCEEDTMPDSRVDEVLALINKQYQKEIHHG